MFEGSVRGKEKGGQLKRDSMQFVCGSVILAVWPFDQLAWSFQRRRFNENVLKPGISPKLWSTNGKNRTICPELFCHSALVYSLEIICLRRSVLGTMRVEGAEF